MSVAGVRRPGGYLSSTAPHTTQASMRIAVVS